MRYFNKSFLFGVLPVLIFTFCMSCRKFVQVDPPKNQIVTSAVFADSVNATAGVLGLYLNMSNASTNFSFANGGITLFTGLSSDELYTTNLDHDQGEFYTNAISSNDYALYSLWTSAYKYIYQANACIEGLTASNGISSLLKNQLTGEAKFARAFIYFYLVNLWGDVPLVISTDYHVNAILPKTSKDSIYKQIIADLTSAQSLLTQTYPSAGRVRPNQYTASALLARVYLYQKQWANAETTANQIISSGSYSLISNLANVFLSNSNEAIWQLQESQSGYETAEGTNFVPTATNVIPQFVISNNLLGTFENNDQRKNSWLKSNTVNSQTYYYPYKYKLGYDGNSSPSEKYCVFRLAELYLIRAEARAQLNNLSGATSDLNIIRNRAGLGNTTAITQSDLLTTIYHERQVELFSEWGHRWLDLKRTGQVNALMSVVTPTKGGTWSTNWQFYPIPYSEIIADPFLVQNTGY